MIYLDYNATTPHDLEVIEAMRPYLEDHFGNPSSSHAFGDNPKRAVAAARRAVAELIGAQPKEVVFTSGGTESNNYAIVGAARARKPRGNHVITSAIEHPAVLNTCAALEREGFEVTLLPVDAYGLVRVEDVKAALRPTTILVTVMHANNEIGTIQPVGEISAVAHAHGVLVHTDAAQTPGKIPVNVAELGVDMLAIAGHKLYAPKGVGALYVRSDLVLEHIMHGGGQEGGRRPGSENVLEIVGLGAACAVAARDLDTNARVMRRTRDLLHERLAAGAEVRLNGHPELRLPNTLSLCFRNTNAAALLSAVYDTVAASAGSACHSGTVSVSPVIKALGVPEDWAMGTLRFSTGKFTTDAEVERAAEAIIAAYR